MYSVTEHRVQSDRDGQQQTRRPLTRLYPPRSIVNALIVIKQPPRESYSVISAIPASHCQSGSSRGDLLPRFLQLPYASQASQLLDYTSEENARGPAQAIAKILEEAYTR